MNTEKLIKNIHKFESDIEGINSSLESKANEVDVRKKNVLIDTNDITDTLRQQITGNAPIMQTIGDGIISPVKTTFIKRGVNLFNKDTIISNKYIGFNNGTLLDHATYKASDYVGITPNTTYSYNNLSAAHFAFYDSNKNFIGITSYNNSIPNPFTTPNNAYYVRFTINPAGNDVNYSILNVGSNNVKYEPYAETLDKKNIQLNFTDLIGIDENIISKTKNIFNMYTALSGYIDYGNGILRAHATYQASDFIEIKPSTVYSYQGVITSHFAFYDANKIYINNTTNNLPNPFTTPSNAYYVRVTILNINTLTASQIEEGSSVTSYEKYGYKIKDTLMDYYVSKTYLQNVLTNKPEKLWSELKSTNLNTIMQVESNNIMKNQIILFTSDVTIFSGIRIGHGKTEYGGNYIEIDNINIKAFNYQGVVIKTIPHGLTINNFINVQIETNTQNQAKITLTTSSDMFESILIDNFVGNNGYVFAENVGSTLTNCILKFSCKDYSKPIYAYGDSYFNNISTSRWTSYIRTKGYDNWLLDGFAGRNSAQAYTSLLNDLQHGTPKYILWCMGMNDADSDIAINSSYKTTLGSVIAICNQKNIELILATIPNVCGNGTTEVIRNHNFKNNYIKSLGKRYIDFALVVNAYNTNAWYTGMLYADGVHPTDLGAKALASRAIIDFPEILNS